MGGEEGFLRFMSQTLSMRAVPQAGLPEKRIAIFLEISARFRSRSPSP